MPYMSAHLAECWRPARGRMRRTLCIKVSKFLSRVTWLRRHLRSRFWAGPIRSDGILAWNYRFDYLAYRCAADMVVALQDPGSAILAVVVGCSGWFYQTIQAPAHGAHWSLADVRLFVRDQCPLE